MVIRLKDGRSYEGTPLRIVEQMRARAFAAQGYTIAGYCDFVVDLTRRFEGIELRVAGDSDEERAEALVREMVEAGLAEVVGA